MAKHKLTKSRKGPYYLLIGPHDSRVIEAIKTLPAKARAWDPALRAWRIAEEHHGEAQALLDGVA